MRVVVIFLYAVVAWAQTLTIEEPSTISTCSVLAIRWTGGTAPFSISIYDGDQPPVPITVIRLITNQYQWNVNRPANTRVFFRVKDSTGATDDTEIKTIVDGTCSSLIPGGSVIIVPTAQPAGQGQSPHTSTVLSSIIPPIVDTSIALGSSIVSTSPNASILPSNPATPSTTLRHEPVSPSDIISHSLSISGGNTVVNSGIGPAGASISSPNLALIIGSAVGGSITLILIVVGICIYRRHRRFTGLVDQLHSNEPVVPMYGPFHSIYPRGRLGENWRPKMGGSSTPSSNEEQLTGTPIPSTIEDLPSTYEGSNSSYDEQNENNVSEIEECMTYEELIGVFCAANRDLISSALEIKLRAAQYLPQNNPSNVSAKLWRRTYDVDFLELRRLQRAYDRNLAAQTAPNAPFRSLQAGITEKNDNEKKTLF